MFKADSINKKLFTFKFYYVYTYEFNYFIKKGEGEEIKVLKLKITQWNLNKYFFQKLNTTNIDIIPYFKFT